MFFFLVSPEPWVLSFVITSAAAIVRSFSFVPKIIFFGGAAGDSSVPECPLTI